MTGYPDDNRPAFRAATKALRAEGYEVISPDELDQTQPIKSKRWEDFMARDIPHLVQADIGVALPGWKHSRGAITEACLLNRLGRHVFQLHGAATLARILPEDLPQIVHP